MSPISNWPDFSEWILDVWFRGKSVGDVPMDAVIDECMSKLTLAEFVRTVCPTGSLPIARGMHGSCAPGRGAFMSLAYPRGTEHDGASYSMNIAYSSKRFAAVGNRYIVDALASVMIGAKRDVLASEASGRAWIACARALIEDAGVPLTHKNAAEALRLTEQGSLVCVKRPVGKLGRWGGDSESGPLMEAEIRVAPYSVEKEAEAIFVLANKDLRVGRAVSDAERRRYALGIWYTATGDYWDSFETSMAKRLSNRKSLGRSDVDVVLHPLCDAKSSNLRRVQLHDEIPETHEWRRLV